MRALSASRIVVDAEVLRLRLQARRLAIRLVLTVVALAFLACTLAFAHVAMFYWLRLDYGWRVHTALMRHSQPRRGAASGPDAEG